MTVPEDRECVTADAAPGGLHNRQRHGSRDRGIHGIAAAHQHGHAGLRRERMGGGDHIPAKDRGPA
jgi:hypothetical protein